MTLFEKILKNEPWLGFLSVLITTIFFFIWGAPISVLFIILTFIISFGIIGFILAYVLSIVVPLFFIVVSISKRKREGRFTAFQIIRLIIYSLSLILSLFWTSLFVLGLISV